MKNNEKAIREFIKTISQAKANLAALTEYVDSHMNTDPDTLNWGHVGNAQYLNSRLEELMESFGLAD